jgi:hypothetical protein
MSAANFREAKNRPLRIKNGTFSASTNGPPSDETHSSMTQPQREALFDLLSLSIYADAHVSLAEEDLLKQTFVKKGRKSDYPKDLFIEESFARAREASESDETVFDYLNKRAAVFTTKGAQKEACDVLNAILESDGMEAEENEFYSLFIQSLPMVK